MKYNGSFLNIQRLGLLHNFLNKIYFNVSLFVIKTLIIRYRTVILKEFTQIHKVKLQ